MRHALFTMPTDQDLLAWFDRAGHPYELREHPATPTVADAERIKLDLPPGHSKSLLLTEKGGGVTLVTARGRARADLKALADALGARRFSFAAPEVMRDILGVSPGELSPLSLINDARSRVGRVVIDAPLLGNDQIWCHPLRNTVSVGLSPAALLAFIRALHGEPHVVDVTAPER